MKQIYCSSANRGRCSEFLFHAESMELSSIHSSDSAYSTQLLDSSSASSEGEEYQPTAETTDDEFWDAKSHPDNGSPVKHAPPPEPHEPLFESQPSLSTCINSLEPHQSSPYYGSSLETQRLSTSHCSPSQPSSDNTNSWIDMYRRHWLVVLLHSRLQSQSYWLRWASYAFAAIAALYTLKRLSRRRRIL
jgi:hypothetical protein